MLTPCKTRLHRKYVKYSVLVLILETGDSGVLRTTILVINTESLREEQPNGHVGCNRYNLYRDNTNNHSRMGYAISCNTYLLYNHLNTKSTLAQIYHMFLEIHQTKQWMMHIILRCILSVHMAWCPPPHVRLPVL